MILPKPKPNSKCLDKSFFFLNIGSQSYKSGHVYTLYSYEAVNEDELSFKCGEEIKILSKNDDEEKNEDCDGWWTARSLKENREGLVPNNFLGVSYLKYLFLVSKAFFIYMCFFF